MGACTLSRPAATVPPDEMLANRIRNDATMPRRKVKSGGLCRSQFILDKSGRVQDFYQMDRKKLGQGTYGSVCRGTHRSTGVVRAIKTLPKGQMRNIERFKKEIAIMKIMDHPSIIKLYETFEDTRNIYLVMELCLGGELFDKVISVGHFSEVDSATVMQQILRAIFYMHKHNICHRDLKPENFLFLTKDPIPSNVLKIIDFGLSCKFGPGSALKTKAGTPYYVAPEVLKGDFDEKCDIWSCGVIMYILLCGYPPFYGNTDAEVLARVRQASVRFESKDWLNVSEDAKDLVLMLLKANPAERWSAEQAVMHPWIKLKAPGATNVSLQQSFLDNLRSFRTQNKLMKAALQVIAGQLNETQIRTLRDTFNTLDQNGDGLLTLGELREGLQQAGLDVLLPDLQDIVDGVDADGSGTIDYTEFLAATLEHQQYLKEDVCWCAFRVFDLDGDGKISPEELRKVLNNSEVEETLGTETNVVLEEVDQNGDGEIDFAEFMAMLKSAGRKAGA